MLVFNFAAFTAVFNTTGASANVAATYNAPVTGGEDALIVDTNYSIDQMTNLSQVANLSNNYSAGAIENDLLIVVHGSQDSAIYVYNETVGLATSVDAGDLSLLAIVHNNNTVGNDTDANGNADDLYVA